MIAQSSSSASKAFALLSLWVLVASGASAAPTTFYTQPQPSNAEQHMLELINQARANPKAEGENLANSSDADVRFYYQQYGMDLNRLRSDFAGYPAQPPLAFNPILMASSKAQSMDQATNGFEGHNSSNGTTFENRVLATGYKAQVIGENVSTYAKDAYFGHVSLNADWGVPQLDHRENIMNYDPSYPTYKEIGISCVGTNVPTFGPMVVTQDFGTPANSSTAYLVGVIYNDLNGNGVYDEGEGLGGVTVTPDGGTYYTTTSASGGFVIPLPTDVSGSLTVTASGGGLGAPRVKTVSYTVGTNVKLDFTPGDTAGAPLAQVAVKSVIRNATADGSQVGILTISRQGDQGSDLTVALAITGNAKSGVDYEPLPSSVTIPAGQNSVQLTVQPVAQQFTVVKKVKVKLASSGSYTPDAAAATAKVKILQ